jgi:hypothetical protein
MQSSSVKKFVKKESKICLPRFVRRLEITKKVTSKREPYFNFNSGNDSEYEEPKKPRQRGRTPRPLLY